MLKRRSVLKTSQMEEVMNRKDKPIIGVDWGTSRTYPAIVDQDGNCQSLLPSGNHLCNGGIPSLFAYNETDGVILCDDVMAEELEIYDPKHVIASVKMQLGQIFQLDDCIFSGEDIASQIIRTQMEYAEKELEMQDLEANSNKVVVCAPVSFGTTERSSLRCAFEKAGYEVVRIIPEPVAAAIYYERKGTVLVLDIGAGTTDAAIVKENTVMTAKNPFPYLFLDSSGVAVAGDMFDEKIADYLAEQFIENVSGIDAKKLRNHQSAAYRRLKVVARKAKEGLSNKTEIGVTFNGNEAGSGRIKLTRQEMNNAIHPLVEQIISCVKTLLARNISVLDQNLEIIMTGGSSYVPYIREQLVNSFSQVSADRIYVRAPEKAIGFGAAMFAADMKKMRLRVDYSYGVNTYIDEVEVIQTLIPAGVELPYTVEHDYCTRYKNQTKVSFQLYEYRLREKTIPLDEQKQMKVSAAVHEFKKAVPKGTKCTAKMTLTEDGILMLQVTSDISDHVGTTSCSIFTDSDSKK